MAQPNLADPAPGLVLAKAALRAADTLGMSKRQLGSVLGIGPSTVSRLADGSRALDPETAEGRIAVLFVRLYRSLFAQFGDDPHPALEWLNGPHELFGRAPIEMLSDPQGLVHVLDYLDALRGR